MYLENVVFDAMDPRALGRFWEAALGTEPLTDEPAGYETRLAVPDGPTLDLCFQPVPEAPEEPQRLRLELTGPAGPAGPADPADPALVVERLLGLGAGRDGDGAGLTDPEGNRFRVVERPTAYAGDGPLAALSLAVADPDRERDFWAWLTGWDLAEGDRPTLRHPSGRGPVLALRPEEEPKVAGKNRSHLDLRLEPGDDVDALAREIAARGGREVHPDWGTLPWRLFVDPSGNELCLLPPYR